MIAFRALGALDLRDSEGREFKTVLAQPKRIALLAYLALASPRGFHRRDTLLALFWPDDDAERARNSLSQSVHVLRRELGSTTVTSRGDDSLGLDATRFWCDALAFEEAVEMGGLERALDLYRGDLLDGFHIARAPEFERWLSTERARLATRYVQAVETLAQERRAANDLDAATALLRQLVTRDPYNSRFTLALMESLIELGDPVAAVQHAREHEKALREELGVAPDPAISALVGEWQVGRAQPTARRTVTPPVRVAEPALRVEEPRERTSGVEWDLPLSAPKSGRRRWQTRMALGVTATLLMVAVGGFAANLKNGSALHIDRPIRSLAVLPFENLSGDSAHQWFAEGMHDALITELARYPDLTVISRTSALRYRGTDKSVRDIVRELQVDAVIQGGVLRDGGRMRMTARLVDGANDRHLWAQPYQRDLRDVLQLQSELAEDIARQVRVVAGPVARKSRRGLPRLSADSLPQELYLQELYLRGRHAELSRSLAGIQAAKEAYRRAIERDSSFALGYAGLAGVYGFLADYGFATVEPALDTARMMAHRAVSLDSTLPETRLALAVTLGDAKEFLSAEREFKRAIELGPSNARAHYWYSILLVALGRGEEARRMSQRAAKLEPFPPRGLVAMQRYAHWLVTGDRPYRRLPVRERRPVLKLEPGEPWARAREAEDLAELGRCAEAKSEIERAQQLAPANIRLSSSVGMVMWWCNERPRARAVLAQMKLRPDARNYGLRMAILHTVFGEKDSAFVWLERNRWTMAELSALSADHYLDPLRSDPRLNQIMKRIGIR